MSITTKQAVDTRGNNDKLIIFFIPPNKAINGGIRSIFSLCEETRKFYSIHKSKSIICVYPGSDSYKKNDLFENNEYIYSFEEITKKFPKLNRLLIHFPEFSISEFPLLFDKYMDYIRKAKNLHINILNQNIELMPAIADIATLLTITNNVTQTTAHTRYCTQETANKYNIPTHLFSTMLDQTQYRATNFDKKLNQIVISHDNNPKRKAILDEIKRKLPDFKTIIVKDLTHEQYKELISKSKYTITFGEGYDGYFIETGFSGSIAFAVYNDEFFPSKEYKKLENVYVDYADMKTKIVSDIKRLNTKLEYEKVLAQNIKLLNKIYSYKIYVENIKLFYQNKYTFYPEIDQSRNFFVKAIEEKDSQLQKIQKSLNITKKELQEQTAISEEQKNVINGMQSSRSWRYTKPIRIVLTKVNKKGHKNR